MVTNYFLYGESIIYYFKHIVFVDAFFIPFARNHRFISFMLYVVGEWTDVTRSIVMLIEGIWDRICGLRFKPAKAIPASAIRLVLLGPH